MKRGAPGSLVGNWLARPLRASTFVSNGSRTSLFQRGSWPEVRRIGEILRQETIGGALLLAAAVVALVWANSPWAAAYDAMSAYVVGPAA